MTSPSLEVPDPGAQHEFEVARSEQNFALAAAAGAISAAVSAGIWAAITAATEYQIGFMAIGVGFLVGLSVRAAGHGVDNSFRALAAVLALVGCAAGNLLSGCIFFAQGHEVGVERVLEVLDLELAQFLMTAMFSPMDVLFYAIAVWEAWRLAIKPG